MKHFRKTLKILFMVFTLFLGATGIGSLYAVPALALTGLTLEVSFADGYDSSQGHVEYQINDGEWVQVTSDTSVTIPEDVDVTSLLFRVVPEDYYEVDFAEGPYLADGTGCAFQAGGADEAREALTGAGYAASLTDGLEKVSLSGVAFLATDQDVTGTVSLHVSGDVGYHYDVPTDLRISINSDHSSTLIPFEAANAVWDGGVEPPNATGVGTASPISYTYTYDNSGTVDFHVNAQANVRITSFKINGTEYASQCPHTEEQILEHISGARSSQFCITGIPYVDSYNIEVVGETHDLMGSFGFNYLDESHPESIAHGLLTFISGSYEGVTYDSVEDWNNALYHGSGEVFEWRDGDKAYTDEADAWGSAAFPKGARITMRLIPDEGYQLTEFYGSEFVAEEEPGVYTITMTGGMNDHLGAVFSPTDDTVFIDAEGVVDGSISNPSNTYGEGTVQLNVLDAALTGESREGFEQTAEEQNAEILSVYDLGLMNLIYKGTDDPEDSWSRESPEMDGAAEITLTLSEDLADADDLVMIHEHDGDFEVLPVTYDAETQTISFETSSFSNFALARVTQEQEETEAPDDQDEPEAPDEQDEALCTIIFDLNGAQPGPYWDDLTADPTAVPGDTEAVFSAEEAAMFAIAPEGYVYGGLEYDGTVYAPGDVFTVPDLETITVRFVWISTAPAETTAASPASPLTGDGMALPCALIVTMLGAAAVMLLCVIARRKAPGSRG